MIKYKLVVSDDAILEIQEAIDWYEEKQKGLGKRFFTALKQRFTAIKRNPFFAVKYDQVRCFKVDKFPYLIHFKVEENSRLVTVVGVLNTSLDPDTHWKKSND